MLRSPRRALPALLLLLPVLGGLLPGNAHAQYFGRNKVRYEDFDFQILKTEHFDIHYYSESGEVPQDVARMAERWYERFAAPEVFNHDFVDRKPIILYANHADFQQTNVLSGFISEGTGGVTESLKNRVILPLTGDYQGTDHVLGHELVHAFQYDIASAPEDTIPFRLNLLPLYLIEGMAEYLSVGREDPHTAMWMRDALLADDFPSIHALATDSRYFPYRFGQALWAYIGGRWGDDKVAKIFCASGRQGFEWALGTNLGVTSDSLSILWKAAVKETYEPALADRVKPKDVGTVLLAQELHGGGALNVAPVLSPDGEHVLFLSEKDLFSVDLFVADAGSGEIERKLVSASTNPHFDALRFIDSAGSWSPDGKRIAFVVFAKGNNEIVIAEAKNGKITSSLRPEGVGAISNPVWSPDGEQLAFSGSSEGVSDLFLLDVKTKKVTRLSRDRYAALQPAWSSDGKTLAYVTDEGPETDLDALRYGPMCIALLDLETGSTRLVRPFPGAKHINPQFSPDGQSLYFISDRGGFSDIYRMNLDTEETYQVTRVATGVSGITALSPAMTVARSSGRILFSVFSGGKYAIHRLEPEAAVGDLVDPTVAVDPRGAVLPPLPPAEAPTDSSRVALYLADAETGLPAENSFTVSKYKPRLQLDYVGGSAGGGVGFGNNSAYLGGAVAAFFSDMLGHHTVGVGIQANGSIKDIGGEAVYQNRKHRWSWGGGVSHIPYQSYFTTVSDTIVDIEGSNYGALKVEQTRDRIYTDEGTLLASYPFSSSRRLELGAGFTHYTYDRELVTEVSVDGYLVQRREEDVPDPPGLGLFQGSIGLVGDNSFFGFTSPIRGERYRIEVSPTFGTLQYTSLLVDYRKYFLLSPTTLAFRGMHAGRYGPDADNPRLTELFIGYATLVRGYASNTFELSECGGGTETDCPEFDRLLGTKMGVANLELRLPFLGTEDFGMFNFPYLPTEILGFVDGGVAWTNRESPKWTFDRTSQERVPVFSTGVAARVNVLGALIVEAYYAFPLQRPEKTGGIFGVQIVPGVVTAGDLSTRFEALVAERGLYSSPANLRFYGRYLFEGIPLAGASFLDVGGGTGIYTFYAAAAGARRAVCLEPEGRGATAGVTTRFQDVYESLGRPEGVRLAPSTLVEFEGDGPFQVVLLNNSVNHLDEEACVRLPGDTEARARYRRQFTRLCELVAPGGRLIVTDCSNQNVFPRFGLKNPLLPMIEWKKHQPPEVWASLLAEAGFTEPRIRWSSFNHLRGPGRLLLGNRAAAFLLTSHFRLVMTRP